MKSRKRPGKDVLADILQGLDEKRARSGKAPNLGQYMERIDTLFLEYQERFDALLAELIARTAEIRKEVEQLPDEERDLLLDCIDEAADAFFDTEEQHLLLDYIDEAADASFDDEEEDDTP